MWYFADIFNAIYFSDTYPADLPVNQHFAGATFANATFEATFAVRQTVAVYRKPSLMQCRSYCKPLFAIYGNTLELETDLFSYRHFENGVLAYFIHFYME